MLGGKRVEFGRKVCGYARRVFAVIILLKYTPRPDRIRSFSTLTRAARDKLSANYAYMLTSLNRVSRNLPTGSKVAYMLSPLISNIIHTYIHH